MPSGIALRGLILAMNTGALVQTQAQPRSLEALSADDTQWPMAPKNYANTRFSGLNQINTQNAGQLKMAWSFSLGADRGQEAAPIVVDGTMYVVSPYAGVSRTGCSRSTPRQETRFGPTRRSLTRRRPVLLAAMS